MRELPATAALVTSLALDPAPSPLELRPPVIRRIMPRITPPLDLTVIPFRYRVSGNTVEAVKSRCTHRRPRTR